MKRGLVKLCSDLDEDGNGTLTLAELRHAYDTSTTFCNIAQLLAVQPDDMEVLFELLDSDGSGDVDYEEFAEELIQIEAEDQRLPIAMTRLGVVHLRTAVEKSISPTLQTIMSQVSLQSSHLASVDRKLNQLLKQSNAPQIVHSSLSSDTSKNTGSVDDAGSLLHQLSCMQNEMEMLASLQKDGITRLEEHVEAVVDKVCSETKHQRCGPDFESNSGGLAFTSECADTFKSTATSLMWCLQDRLSQLTKEVHEGNDKFGTALKLTRDLWEALRLEANKAGSHAESHASTKAVKQTHFLIDRV